MGSRVYKTIRNQLAKSPCTEDLSTSSSAKVYRYCTEASCKHCFAVKFARDANEEIYMLKYLQLATNGTPFARHVVQFVKSYPMDTILSAVIVTEHVTPISPGIRDVADLFEREISVQEGSVLLIQIFATLDWLHIHADGFVHMDLHLGNVAMTSWPKTLYDERLTTRAGTFTIPRQRYWPVLLDVGNSYTTRFKNKKLYGLNSPCTLPKSDIYKFLVLHLYPYVLGDFKRFLGSLISYLFPKPLARAYIDQEYRTVIPRGCKLLPNVSYADVLSFPGFEKYRTT